MNQKPGRIADQADLKLLSIIDRLLASQRRWGFEFSTDYRRLLMGEPLESNTTPIDASLKTFRGMLIGVWAVIGVLVGVLAVVFSQVIDLEGFSGVVARTIWGFMVGAPVAMSILRGLPERQWGRIDTASDSLLFMLWLVLGIVFAWVLA